MITSAKGQVVIPKKVRDKVGMDADIASTGFKTQ